MPQTLNPQTLIISQAALPTQIAAVRDLLREYLDWVLPIEACSHHAPTFRGIEQELETLPGPFAPPGGRILMATAGGVAAGCVALKPYKELTCELKRMFVRPQFRGQGIGRTLVE